MIDWTLFGWVIRQLRHKRKWNQGELSKLAMLDTSYLSQIETGKKENVSIGAIGRLATALDIEPMSLIALCLVNTDPTDTIGVLFEEFKQIIADNWRVERVMP
jgi:transcriptional regulator with XRE-family HTH domain